MKRIIIDFIPHKKQRYDTLGDWQFKNDVLTIKISKIKSWKKEVSLAIHEMVEALLCKERRITTKAVDNWDLNFNGDGEPGDDRNCPYFSQHQDASVVERYLAKKLGLNWEEYENFLDGL
jgi:hypothetical protein